MKKIIITTAMIGLCTCLAVAQNNKTEATPTQEVKKVEKKPIQEVPPRDRVAREPRSQSHIDEMDAVVTLTEKQKSEMNTINQEHNTTMRAIRMKYRDAEDKSPMKAEIQKAQEERKNKIHAVLDEEQKAKWKAHKKNERAEKAE